MSTSGPDQARVGTQADAGSGVPDTPGADDARPPASRALPGADASASAASAAPTPSSAHVERIGEEVRVQQRVHDERDERRQQACSRRRSARSAREQGERRRQQREVDEQAGDPLLAGDRYRDRVRRRDGSVERGAGRRVPDVAGFAAAVLDGEAPRAPALQGSLGEQIGAPLDQRRASARCVSECLRPTEIDVHDAAEGDQEDDAENGCAAGDEPDHALVEAQRREHDETGEQGHEARLRDRADHPQPDHRECRPSQHDLPGTATPEHRRGQQQRHEREETAVDVGVIEERVHTKRGSEDVGGLQRRVEQQVTCGQLSKADHRDAQRDRHQLEQTQPQQAGVPVHAREEHEQQRERHIEEHDLTERDVELRRVQRLRRVEHDADGQQRRDDTHATGRRRFGRRVGARRPGARAHRAAHQRRDPRDRAAGDHDIERDQQVGRAAAQRDRHAKRHRRYGQQRKQQRAAMHQPGEPGECGQRDEGSKYGRRGVVAYDREGQRVPAVHREQHRRRDQRERRRERPQALARGDERGRREHRAEHRRTLLLGHARGRGEHERAHGHGNSNSSALAIE